MLKQKQEGIKEILMRRDGVTEAEALATIAEAKEALLKYIEAGDLCGAEDICQEFFGLEPDYLDEIML